MIFFAFPVIFDAARCRSATEGPDRGCFFQKIAHKAKKIKQNLKKEYRKKYPANPQYIAPDFPNMQKGLRGLPDLRTDPWNVVPCVRITCSRPDGDADRKQEAGCK
jgi:hypothetical protein